MSIYNDKITIDMFCNCFYRDYDFMCDDNILVLFPKFKQTELNALYITTIINRDKIHYSYGKQYRQKSFAEHHIILPTTKDGNLAFDYMEAYIRELEEERIRELAAYLAVSELEDYKLTSKEQEAICLLRENKVKTKEFRIEDVFEKLDLGIINKSFDKKKDVKQQRDNIYSLPIINAKHGNNGIMFYGKPEDFETAEMTIDIVKNGAIATGDVYPQPQKTGVLWDAYLIKLKSKEPTVELLLYFTRCIEKAIKLRFSYENKAIWEKVKNVEITLPIATSGEIDYDFMQTYITAIQKLAIKNVVLWKDKQIKATKKIVGLDCHADK